MKLEREGKAPIVDPSPERLARELRKLRTVGPSSFAILTASSGDYLQAAGSPGGLLLEKRHASGRHFRAFQQPAVVGFADGTVLVLAMGDIKLRAGEWFKLSQVLEAFVAFARGQPEPDYLLWRDITQLLSRPVDPRAS